MVYKINSKDIQSSLPLPIISLALSPDYRQYPMGITLKNLWEDMEYISSSSGNSSKAIFPPSLTRNC